MELKVRIVDSNRIVSFKDAVINHRITLSYDSIIPGECVDVLLSTGLVDINGTEIYENDELVNDSGNIYTVYYAHGAFFACKANDNQNPYFNKIPLFHLQSNGHIPAKIANSNN